MPTVHSEDGFDVRIYLPPREHSPAHVHLVKAGGEAIINLGEAEPELREIHNMSRRDVVRAFRIVEAAREQLLEKWSEYHG